jgi:tight adherence protein B
LVFGTVALALLAIAQFAFPDRPKMASMISAYGDPAAALADDGGRHVQLAETGFVQRAVEATAKIAEERGFLHSIERALQQADAPLRAAEAFFFTNAAVLVTAMLVHVLVGSWLVTLIALVVGGLLPPAYLKFRIARRKRKFLNQLPDTLQLLAGSLRAGYSLMQGVETVAHEIRGPMAKELQIVLTETKLGRQLEEALEDAARRLGSPDFDWVVMAIGIQREVGGNLAELLSTVAETMIARQRLRREVRALTAEGRMTAVILGILPIAIGLALWVLNPDYLRVMFDRTIGKIVLAGSTVWALFGFFWMKKIIAVEA